ASPVSESDARLARRFADDLGEGRRAAVEDDDGLDPSIVELMLELARRVERIDTDLHPAGTDDAEHGEREGCDVGEHHGDAPARCRAIWSMRRRCCRRAARTKPPRHS